MLLGTRMTNNEPSAIRDLDVVARYDATDPNYVIKDSSNRISALLDKSKRLALGNELVVNGNFNTDSSWIKTTTDWTISNGNAYCSIVNNTASYLRQDGILALQKMYLVEATINIVSGIVDYVAGNAGESKRLINGYNKFYIYHSGITGDAVFRSFGTFVGSIDNVSIKEVLGNHITQTDITKMPIHTNRYNLLTYSEDFTVSGTIWGLLFMTTSKQVIKKSERNR